MPEHVHSKVTGGAPGVHLRAPAGAGKTFVALHRVLRALRDECPGVGADDYR